MTQKEQKFVDFKNNFLNFKEQVDKYDISNETDENLIIEFAKSKETIEYIVKFLDLLNPNQLPLDFFPASYLSFNASLNFANLFNRNDNNSLINVLNFYLKQIALYSNIYIPKNQISSTISEMVCAYEKEISKSLERINLKQFEDNSKLISDYKHKLLDSEDNIKDTIKDSQDTITQWYNKIKELNDEIFVNENNIKTQIEIGKSELEDFRNKKEELDEFYINIFGEVDENDKKIKGLKEEFNERVKEFDDFKEEKTKEIENLLEEAKKLLDISTNASLASAFQKAKEGFESSIIVWNVVFILSIVFFGIFAFCGINEAKSFLASGDYNKALIALFGNLLIYIPLSWLAIFASRRRNENKKLQEEYRYKETIAKSYMGYKEQIEERDNLENELIHNLLDMLKDNPNNKFANNHNNENIPIFEFIDKISKMPSDNREKLANLIKGTK